MAGRGGVAVDVLVVPHVAGVPLVRHPVREIENGYGTEVVEPENVVAVGTRVVEVPEGAPHPQLVLPPVAAARRRVAVLEVPAQGPAAGAEPAVRHVAARIADPARQEVGKALEEGHAEARRIAGGQAVGAPGVRRPLIVPVLVVQLVPELVGDDLRLDGMRGDQPDVPADVGAAPRVSAAVAAVVGRVGRVDLDGGSGHRVDSTVPVEPRPGVHRGVDELAHAVVRPSVGVRVTVPDAEVGGDVEPVGIHPDVAIAREVLHVVVARLRPVVDPQAIAAEDRHSRDVEAPGAVRLHPVLGQLDPDPEEVVAPGFDAEAEARVQAVIGRPLGREPPGDVIGQGRRRRRQPGPPSPGPDPDVIVLLVAHLGPAERALLSEDAGEGLPEERAAVVLGLARNGTVGAEAQNVHGQLGGVLLVVPGRPAEQEIGIGLAEDVVVVAHEPGVLGRVESVVEVDHQLGCGMPTTHDVRPLAADVLVEVDPPEIVLGEDVHLDGQARAEALRHVAQEIDGQRHVQRRPRLQEHRGLGSADPPAWPRILPLGVEGLRTELEDVVEVEDGAVGARRVLTTAREDNEKAGVGKILEPGQSDQHPGIPSGGGPRQVFPGLRRLDEGPVSRPGFVGRARAHPGQAEKQHHDIRRDKPSDHGLALAPSVRQETQFRDGSS